MTLTNTTILRLPLAADEETVSRLDAVATDCRRGFNAAVENWLLRQRGLPETAKQAPVKESTKLYHAVRAAAPGIPGMVASSLAQELRTLLSAKVDWRRRGDGLQRRKDAVLAYEDRPPFRTALQVPLHNLLAEIEVSDGAVTLLASTLSGETGVKLRLPIKGKLTPGYRRLLMAVANGGSKLRDSKLQRRDNGWEWHLPVQTEREQVDSEIVATLTPAIDADEQARPLSLTWEGGERGWGVGDGRYLLAQMRRLIALRKQIGWRYRQRQGAGHGRAKIDAAMRKRRTQERNIIAEVRRRAIADVVRQCQRVGAGTLVYREPTGPVKTRCWFDRAGVNWDWTRFAGDLKNSLARAGIAMKMQKLKLAEVNGET